VSDPDGICPACGADLERVSTAGALRFQCGSCRGAAFGLPVMRRLLADGAAIQAWMVSKSVEPTGQPCGFCRQPQRPVSLSSGTPPTASVEVCRPCEMIWVPADQLAALPAREAAAAGRATAAAVAPACCPSCGAPLQTDADGTCRYCHRQAVAPQLVVIAGAPAPDAPSGSQGILGAAVSLLDQLLRS